MDCYTIEAAKVDSMANQEHLDILMQGVDNWNQWRLANPFVIPDLYGVNLEKMDFRGTKLYIEAWDTTITDETYLIGVNLLDAHLSDAHLKGVNLDGAFLRNAHLFATDLASSFIRKAN